MGQTETPSEMIPQRCVSVFFLEGNLGRARRRCLTDFFFTEPSPQHSCHGACVPWHLFDDFSRVCHCHCHLPVFACEQCVDATVHSHTPSICSFLRSWLELDHVEVHKFQSVGTRARKMCMSNRVGCATDRVCCTTNGTHSLRLFIPPNSVRPWDASTS